MLFHVDLIYLAKQAKCDVGKSFAVHAGVERNVCNIVVSIHFKYILAGRQDLILTSVVHLRKRLT